MARNSNFARAFTLIELIVVLAIIAILMSMVYPMFTSMSERAKATKDLSNLRQIGIATQTYLNDSDAVLPGSIGQEPALCQRNLVGGGSGVRKA